MPQFVLTSEQYALFCFICGACVYQIIDHIEIAISYNSFLLLIADLHSYPPQLCAQSMWMCIFKFI